jgi:hypothetical protein
MVCNDQLVLLRGEAAASPEAIVCLTSDGQLRWRGTLTVDAKKVTAELATFDEKSRPRSKIAFPFAAAPAGIAYRDAVVQPDLSR